jgi:hypothetical protein
MLPILCLSVVEINYASFFSKIGSVWISEMEEKTHIEKYLDHSFNNKTSINMSLRQPKKFGTKISFWVCYIDQVQKIKYHFFLKKKWCDFLPLFIMKESKNIEGRVMKSIKIIKYEDKGKNRKF